ncbi:Spermidine/putrescine import ATP-binding protein PotA [Roseovarius sp. THAF27]|uniref:ABC transporter ATP-binding protein n=1 Tax=Roseovarius sp. THAF27 TaxID=2587850 RepID=UPI001268CFB7|nr:ABC transporter ATP-binding protein [Roseovarius sp. THAF27]QFT82355.1 Spermidine/putrescine import ATP-binding protein PotA [Roseovarius sp. THAF27]
MSPILSVKDATKRYSTPEGGTITALDGVSLDVQQNEFVTLLGPSGCGKTTLLRTISGFEDLEGGSIEIDGTPVTHLPPHRRPVNTVFQRYALFPHLTIARNVAYSLEVAGLKRAEIGSRVGEMLELVGLGGFGDRKINQLSGGQQQRVALARSLVARPKILLLDEPLSALDKNLRQKMQQELKTLQEEVGIAFVFVTHDQEEALTMSDRVAVLSDGKIQQFGTPEELYRRPRNEFVARFLGAGNLLGATVSERKEAGAIAILESGQVAHLPSTDAARGERIKLLIRPEDVRMDSTRDAGALRFEGTVRQVLFVGTDYIVHVETDDGVELKATLRPRAEDRGGVTAPGARITLFVQHEALHPVTSARVA